MSEHSSTASTGIDTNLTELTTLSLGTDAMIASDTSTIAVTAPSGHTALIEAPTQNAGEDMHLPSNETIQTISIGDSTTAPVIDIALDRYVFSLSGTTVQASTSSGVELWSTTVPAAQSLTTLNTDGVLACLTETGTIIGLDAETGTELFSVDRPHAEVSEPQAITGAEGYLAIGAWSFLVVFDSAGNCILEKNLDGTISDLAVLSDAVVVTLQHGNIQRVSYSNGDIEWSQHTTANDIDGTATGSVYAITDNHITHLDVVGRADPVIDAGGDQLMATADPTVLVTTDGGTQSVYQQQTATEPAVTATLLSDTIRSDDSIRFQIENTGTANVSGNVKIQPPEMALTLGSPTPSTVSLTPEEAATVAAPIRELPSDSPSQSVTVDLFIDELKVVSESIKLATQSPSSVETTDGNSGENTPASSSNPMHDTDTDTATDAVEKNVKGSQTQDSISSLRNKSLSESSTDTQIESPSENARTSVDTSNENKNAAQMDANYSNKRSHPSQSESTKAIDAATANAQSGEITTQTSIAAQSQLFDDIETSVDIEAIRADHASISLTVTNQLDTEATISIETAQTVIDAGETSTLQTSITYPSSDEMGDETDLSSLSSTVPTLAVTVEGKTEERALMPDLSLERPSIDITPTGSVTTPFIDIILSIPFDVRFTDKLSVMIGDTEFIRQITVDGPTKFYFALPISTAVVTIGTVIEVAATLGSESDTSLSHKTQIDASEWIHIDSDSKHATHSEAPSSSTSVDQEIAHPLSPIDVESETQTISDSDEIVNADSSESSISETVTSDDHLQELPATTADESNKESELPPNQQSNVTVAEQEATDAEQSARTDIETNRSKHNRDDISDTSTDDTDGSTTRLDLSSARNAGANDLTGENTQPHITSNSDDRGKTGDEHTGRKDDVNDSDNTIDSDSDSDSDSQTTSEQSAQSSAESESPVECTRVVPDTVPYGHRFEESIVITNTGSRTIETASISLAETSLNLDAIDPGEQSTVTRAHAGFDPGSWNLEPGQVIIPDATVDIPQKSIDIQPNPMSDTSADTKQVASSTANVDPFIAYVTLHDGIIQFECHNLGSSPCDLTSLAADSPDNNASTISWSFDDPPVLDAGETTQFECGGGADTESLTPPFTARIRYRRTIPEDDHESTLEHTTLAIPQTAAATGGDTPLSLSVQPESQPVIDEHNTIACTLTTDASITDVVVEATGDIVAPLSVGERSLGRVKNGRTNRQLFDITPQQGPTASFHVRVSATLDGSSFSQHYRITGPIERSDSSNLDESAWQVVPVADTETAEAEAEAEAETTPPNVRVTTTPQVQSKSHH